MEETNVNTDTYEEIMTSQTEIFQSKAAFEVKIATQKDVKNYEVIEALEENYCGGLRPPH